MRYAIALSLLLCSPVAAQQSPEEAFNGFREIPCRTYVNPKTDPTGDIVDLMPEIRTSIQGYVVSRGAFDSYPSECNVNAYVEAECRLSPKATIGRAVDSLYAKKRAGRPLPSPHVCGA